MPRKPARKTAAHRPSKTVADLPAQPLTPEAGAELKGGSVSKYIGETEKSLDRVFSDATKADATIFFDESDALFKR